MIFHRHVWKIDKPLVKTTYGLFKEDATVAHEWKCIKCGKHNVFYVSSPPKWQAEE